MGHFRPPFSFIFVCWIQLTVGKMLLFKKSPLPGLKPWTSGVGSDSSANWATTTAHGSVDLHWCLVEQQRTWRDKDGCWNCSSSSAKNLNVDKIHSEKKLFVSGLSCVINVSGARNSPLSKREQAIYQLAPMFKNGTNQALILFVFVLF